MIRLMSFLFLLLTACQNNSGATPNNPNTNPQGSGQWIRIFGTFTSTDTIEDGCGSTVEFTVNSDGTYSAPCFANPSNNQSGTLSAAELSELNRRVSDYLATDLSKKICEGVHGFTNGYGELTLSNGTTHRFIEWDVNRGQACYLGDIEEARRFDSHMAELYQRHKPAHR